ncbi:MAG: hypothetical protein AAF587_02300 [Bacteroidota bacterium]
MSNLRIWQADLKEIVCYQETYPDTLRYRDASVSSSEKIRKEALDV